MVVRCSENETLVGELQKGAKRMEDDLKKWTEEVRKNRTECYELNNYTTTQLVILRRQLGRMKTHGGTSAIDPGVMLLLHSISPDLTPAAIKDSVQNILIEMAHSECEVAEPMCTAQPDMFSQQALPLSVHDNLYSNRESCASKGTMNVNQFEPKVILDSVAVDGIKSNSATTSQGKQSSTLCVEQLSGRFKDIYINLTSTFGYQPKLVLSALEHCSDDRYAAEIWCQEHMDSFDAADDDDDGVLYSESDEEPMEETEQKSNYQSETHGK